MEKLSIAFENIALVKEIESPENPGGLEKRVALTPKDVGQLTDAGVDVFVEYGAGLGVNFEDAEYLQNGAVMQKADEIYKDKELIIKFKGPSLESISEMKKGCTLFCMAHFHSFPDRAKMLEETHSHIFNLHKFELENGDTAIADYREIHTPFEMDHWLKDVGVGTLVPSDGTKVPAPSIY